MVERCRAGNGWAKETLLRAMIRKDAASLSGGTVSSRCKVRSVTNSAQLTATLRTVSIARRPLRNAFLRTNPGMVMPEARCRRSGGDGVPWESAELMPQTHPFRGEGFGCHSWPPWDRG